MVAESVLVSALISVGWGLSIKSMGNFVLVWVESRRKGLIVSEPRHSAVLASWNNATFLAIVSG